MSGGFQVDGNGAPGNLEGLGNRSHTPTAAVHRNHTLACVVIHNFRTPTKLSLRARCSLLCLGYDALCSSATLGANRCQILANGFGASLICGSLRKMLSRPCGLCRLGAWPVVS